MTGSQLPGTSRTFMPLSIRLANCLLLLAILALTGCAGNIAHKSTLAPFAASSSYRPLDSAIFIEMAALDGYENEVMEALDSELTPDLGSAFRMGEADAEDMADAQDLDTGLTVADFGRFTLSGRPATGGDRFDNLLKTAFLQVGASYRSGGTTPRGFDCSGFTSWVYAQSGIDLPRSSREQFKAGLSVSREKLKRGDLVFFKRKTTISHVGIYVENGNFIHSTSDGGTVKVSNLDEPFWSRIYAGGRRVVR